MGRSKRLICDSAILQEGGKGVRFIVERQGESQPAFAIRHQGAVYAYLNRCAHIATELDWAEGEFFDLTGLYLMCSTHGATYLPNTGRCLRGPCSGRGLARLPVEESGGKVYLLSEQ
ncbi:MAG TPA: Rieske 2Fe-2S domain-containing protein [Burkholderiales bacterium]|nr:Rieske 2Fe-2S domain-containing protein [Burkholderiales bacterium]